MSFFKLFSLASLLVQAINAIPTQKAREALDDVIDVVEDYAVGFPVAQAAAAKAREVLQIPDDIGGDEN